LAYPLLLLIAGAVFGVAPAAAAQVADLPTDQVTGPVTDTVTDTVDQVGGTVGDTTGPVTDTVTETVDGVTGPTDEVTDPVTGTVDETVGGTVKETAEAANDGSGGGVGRLRDLMDGITGDGSNPTPTSPTVGGTVMALPDGTKVLAPDLNAIRGTDVGATSGGAAGSVGSTTSSGVADPALRSDSDDSGRSSPGILEQALAIALTAVKKVAFPLALIALVAGFLVVHGRLGRKDPKLALAPLAADQDAMTFR
ncbi:MAG: hypothetical protein M3238_02850, partial [Actinomycetota bacterium]|nr:hypothetical protein [Actinomycetota bacterium]